MKGKLAVLSFLIFALATATSIACVFANFTPVLPSDNIAIEADGRVTGTYTIIRNGDTYTFTGNVSGTKTRQGDSRGNVSCALAVYRSHVTIDGAGFTLQCNNLTGIDLSNGVCKSHSEREVWNVTIKNLRIINFTQGINCDFGGNHTFYGNYISNDIVTHNGTGDFSWVTIGIALWGSRGVNISHCTIGGSPAIYMHFAVSNNFVVENNIVFGAHLAISGTETFDRNYWSDYSLRYPNASEADSSGMWNMPYGFADSTNFENRKFQDAHPLRYPLAIPNFSSFLPTVKSAQEPSVFPISLYSVFIIVAATSIVTGLLIYLNKRHKTEKRTSL